MVLNSLAESKLNLIEVETSKFNILRIWGNKLQRGRGHVSTPGMENAVVGVRWEDLVPEQFKFCT